MTRTCIQFALGSLLLAAVPLSATANENAPSETVDTNAPQAWQPEDGDVISFKVLRKGKPFGTHTVSFDVDSDGSFTATSEVELKAGFGPITLYRYELNTTETWEDGVLVGLEGQTNDDGDDEAVSASLEEGKLAVAGTGFEGAVPVGIIPSSHWNIQEAFSSKIISTQDGEILDVDVTTIGEDTVTVAGEEVPATHYRLVSDLTVDLWYDEQSRWVKLSFEARGQKIDYVLNALY
ncbi:DUF6134 family protein [Henriciella litoralis]|uniref:DUF6134 family protein n=1 Tax=Henriciella litoralis TaxID=568102 RepID=UPI0009FE8E2C|nr:DUF6134 family protein [Henriciella litoralis]